MGSLDIFTSATDKAHFTRRIFFSRSTFVGFSHTFKTSAVHITTVPEVVIAEPDATSFANIQL